MPTRLEIAKDLLLKPAHLTEADLAKTMDILTAHQADIADIYFQQSRLESWVLEDGIIKEGAYHIEQGVGLRAVCGEKTGFAYSEEMSLNHLIEAAKTARVINKAGQSRKIKIQACTPKTQLYCTDNPLKSLSETEKINLLQQLDQTARQQDSKVKEVICSLVSAHDVVLILNEQGILTADVRPMVRCNVTVIVEHNGKREQASSGGGGRHIFALLSADNKVENYAKEAVRQALVKLDAIEAPAGMMPVVLGSGWPGVLLHEAIGHGLEGDFNRKGTSAFAGKMGEQVASALCTIVDNGTIDNRRGSLTIDDEGTPTGERVLIEKGILKGYMQDRLNAKLMGEQPTGNGRRESYAYLPLPRMTNTYMLAGKTAPEEIIQSVKKGLYAVNFGGGQVDITSGKFVFSASEAYLIENGKITAPVKGATLIGNGPESLKQISMVGHDLALDGGVGVCGKEGQSLPVGVGQPTLKLDEMTVGGTQT